MAAKEPRLTRRIRRDFAEPGAAEEALGLLADLPYLTGDEMHGTERVRAAIVLLASGDRGRLRDAIALSMRDWRDLLVAADLAQRDWPDKLDRELGPR